MTDDNLDTNQQAEPESELRARIERLEQDASAYRRDSESRLVHAEMKVHALRAGMIDLDGLKFLELDSIGLSEDGQVPEAADMIGNLKRAKPWLFGISSSSSVRPPPSKAIQPKLAMDMTDEEYRLAKARMIRHAAV